MCQSVVPTKIGNKYRYRYTPSCSEVWHIHLANVGIVQGGINLVQHEEGSRLEAVTKMATVVAFLLPNPMVMNILFSLQQRYTFGIF